MDLTKAQWDFQNDGEFLLVDKPLDWSSFDVVKKIKRLFDVRRVGHAGTLDPKASGLLIVCTGRKTKTLDSFQAYEKEYVGTFELGVRTPSFDSETDVTEKKDYTSVDRAALEQAMTRFVGTLRQKPPMFSASKFEGTPLYILARRGAVVERQEKEIRVREFTITSLASPIVEFRIVCSKGTYVRTLIDDLGLALGCGCTLRSLRRTRIGPYTVEDALSIDDLAKLSGTLERNKQVYEIGEPAS